MRRAKILYVQGRQHPVKIFHAAQSQEDYIQSAMRAFFQIHTERPPGDVLIFLPGQEDIEALESSIKLFANRLPKQHMNVTFLSPSFLPLTLTYGSIGTSMSHVRSSGSWQERKSIPTSATKCTQVHIGD